MGRTPNTFNKVPVVTPSNFDEVAQVINRLQDRLVESLRPIAENPMLVISDFRFVEAAGPLFQLQHRVGVAGWKTIASFDAVGNLTAPVP